MKPMISSRVARRWAVPLAFGAVLPASATLPAQILERGNIYRIRFSRPGRTCSFAFFTNESFRYALAEVGDREERVYAVHPRGTSLEELPARKKASFPRDGDRDRR